MVVEKKKRDGLMALAMILETSCRDGECFENAVVVCVECFLNGCSTCLVGLDLCVVQALNDACAHSYGDDHVHALALDGPERVTRASHVMLVRIIQYIDIHGLRVYDGEIRCAAEMAVDVAFHACLVRSGNAYFHGFVTPSEHDARRRHLSCL
jgi:hypothetical protein